MQLTKPQKQIYDTDKVIGGAVSNICGSIIIEGTIDTTLLKNSVNELFRLNDSLRIRVSEHNEEPSQSIANYIPKNITTLFFESQKQLDDYAQKIAQQPMDIYGELCEINIISLPMSYGLLIKMHHLVGDAWTLSLLCSQFISILNGKSPVTYSYADYVAKEHMYLTSSRYDKDRKYFLEQFKNNDDVSYLEARHYSSLKSNRKTISINKRETAHIYDFSKKHEVSVFSIFFTALSVLLSRININMEKFYIGTAVLNREAYSEKNTAGMFINTVPVLVNLDYKESFLRNLENIEESLFATFRHQKYNYSDILGDIRTEFNFGEKLYDVLLSYQNAAIDCGDTEVKTSWYHTGITTESLEIHIDDRDKSGELRINYDYHFEKYSAEEIDRFHSHLMNIICHAVSESNISISTIDFLSAKEKDRIICEFNNTRSQYPSKCIHQLFEEQVSKTPEAIAIVFEDTCITYKQLDEMSNSLAHYLREIGVCTNSICPIISQRSYHLIVAMLGVLKAGGAYIPVDYSYPLDRIEAICADSNPTVVLTYKYDQPLECNLINLETFDYGYDQSKTDNIAKTDDLCYIIFTSGSTGHPKGVKINHSNLVNYCYRSDTNHMVKDLCSVSVQPTIISVNNPCFDAFIDESILPLVNGFKIYFTNHIEALEHSAFRKIIKSNDIDIVSTTPTKLKMLTGSDKVPFKRILLGGEQVTKEYITDLETRTTAKIYNTYGPTEITVGCTYGLISDKNSIHIGRPIANTEIYILDNHMNPTPIGAAGELCVAGSGVGSGYLNRTELTDQKFVDNPFGKGKLYKTGDVASWRDDGNIEYIGRNDYQVKIRGLRIELGEIEASISSIDGVTETIVTVPVDETGRQYIVAYYTGKYVDAQVIRSSISKKLPKYMVPQVFYHMDKFPISSSGKVQRNALPKVEFSDIEFNTEYVAPQNETQRDLCAIIQSVLKIPQVGINDDFFDIGGDSLRAIEFVSKARSHAFYFSAQKVFDYRTVRGLSEYIVSGNENVAAINKDRLVKVQEFLSQNGIIKSNTIDHALGNILLTGSTGFLGSHILADFLKNDTGIAYCLVRGKDNNDSKNRLLETLTYYFQNQELPHERIVVLCGDLQEDKFGLSSDEYECLIGNVDIVINAAASVKHYGSYEYFYEVNVETIKRMIDFCKCSNSKLIHISTTSVSGDKLAENSSDMPILFDEKSLYVNQSLENVYVRSKFEAEVCVLEAIIDGLKANIVRVGNLTNRSTDGVFQRNYESNAFLKRITAIIKLKMWPKYLQDLMVDFTPVDDTASAILTIARNFSRDNIVFHMINPYILSMGNMCNIFTKLGCKIDIVEDSLFNEEIESQMQTDFSEISEAFVNDMDENDQIFYNSDIIVGNSLTVKHLRSLGFKWTNIDEMYFSMYIKHLAELGLL